MKTYPYPYHKGIIRECTREPLEKPPKPGLLPRPRKVSMISCFFLHKDYRKNFVINLRFTFQNILVYLEHEKIKVNWNTHQTLM